MKIIGIISLSIFVLIGCSTNEKILMDSRYKISNSSEWKINFSLKESGSGIIFKFIKDKYVKETPKYVNMFLWSYPLDTVTIVKEVFNEPRPMAPNDFEDITYINYKIKNDTIKISSVVDSTNQIVKEIQPNKYLLLIQSLGFSQFYLKDIRVVEGYWSIVEIKMHLQPLELYQNKKCNLTSGSSRPLPRSGCF